MRVVSSLVESDSIFQFQQEYYKNKRDPIQLFISLHKIASTQPTVIVR
jgi:hypothetical protein